MLYNLYKKFKLNNKGIKTTAIVSNVVEALGEHFTH